MLDLTKLLSNTSSEDSIRYSKECLQTKTGTRAGFGPVIAFNITKKCNFKCKHCYSNAGGSCDEELSTEEVKKTVDDFAEMNVPVVLLSGGEPLMREDIFEIIEYIRAKGIKVSISTNGSLIDKDVAKKLLKLGISYVGISLDGSKGINDNFRGKEGAFEAALEGIKNCEAIGQKVGLRFTLNKYNRVDIPYVFQLAEEQGIKRICFYHLVPAGRGEDIAASVLTWEETRAVLDELYAYAKEQVNKEEPMEILTVANHCDGPYLYMKSKREDEATGERILQLLTQNRGNRSGMAIACIDWEGNVYPDQFTRFYKVGNLREKSFTEIWGETNPGLVLFRDRQKSLSSKCQNCRWLNLCNGNLRARAYQHHGDIWGDDPACYLGADER